MDTNLLRWFLRDVEGGGGAADDRYWRTCHRGRDLLDDACEVRQCGRSLRDCDAAQLRAVIAACWTARRRRRAEA